MYPKFAGFLLLSKTDMKKIFAACIYIQFSVSNINIAFSSLASLCK